GIYAPHLGSELVRVTRTAEWRIVSKLLAVEPLTLKSGIAAPRSSVNNCGGSMCDNNVKQSLINSFPVQNMHQYRNHSIRRIELSLREGYDFDK
ncbi:hypothetical protein, partial [Enterobacter asburiae]